MTARVVFALLEVANRRSNPRSVPDDTIFSQTPRRIFDEFADACSPTALLLCACVLMSMCVRTYTLTRTRTRARAHQPRFLREGITTRRRHQQLTYATWPHGMVIPVTTSRKLSMFVIHDARARDRALTHASPVVVRRVTPTCKMVSCESRSTMPLKPAPHPRS